MSIACASVHTYVCMYVRMYNLPVQLKCPLTINILHEVNKHTVLICPSLFLAVWSYHGSTDFIISQVALWTECGLVVLVRGLRPHPALPHVPLYNHTLSIPWSAPYMCRHGEHAIHASSEAVIFKLTCPGVGTEPLNMAGTQDEAKPNGFDHATIKFYMLGSPTSYSRCGYLY